MWYLNFKADLPSEFKPVDELPIEMVNVASYIPVSSSACDLYCFGVDTESIAITAQIVSNQAL